MTKKYLPMAMTKAEQALAQAAGYVLTDGSAGYRAFRCMGGVEWNPLQADGDALRLAVKLRMEIEHNHPADQQAWVATEIRGCEGCWAPVSCVEDEFDEAGRTAATRRAIVRAAAAIGEAQKQEGG